ncbi:putative Iron-regulated transporter [Pleurostoma richardsiae]|uniref:Solute carrier family 40 member n=1 Tax=Pleurostoma richardsiae TaxID=41990 RepID=A0AA38VTG2_9PEZI|nr:putative Iron-regulated transporter [Pleurostoma richardsiae]
MADRRSIAAEEADLERQVADEDFIISHPAPTATPVHNDPWGRPASPSPDHAPPSGGVPYAPEPPMRDIPSSAGGPVPAAVSRATARLLYTSHFLSTWNSRLFEFAAVLFLAALYPGTLLPVSAYALARCAAGVLLAAPVGSWIDSGDRLSVVRASIVGGRVAVVASCVVFWAMERRGSSVGKDGKDGLFALLVMAACVEKLCAMMNLVAVERDWVVVITEGNEDARQLLNARMRRIDLFCKLVGPLVISVIAVASTLAAVYTTLAMNVVSVLVEYFCIARVYKAVPNLRRSAEESSPAEPIELDTPAAAASLLRPQSRRRTLYSRTTSFLKQTAFRVLPLSSLPFYLRHRAFLPSLSLSLLYLTVLSFSGQMITYLVSVGYTSLHVGIARTVSTIFELSATWAAPRLMRRVGAVRGGIWSLSWQMIWLAAAVSWFFTDTEGGSVAAATGLAVGVALSRVGLWGFDLCAQCIVQDEVEFDHRGAFSTVEAALQNLFELLSYACTMIFSRPDQFRWPVAISVVAVYAAGGLYAAFVRRRRGHLFHAPPCSVCTKLEGHRQGTGALGRRW